MANIIFGNGDELLRADRRTGVAGDFLRTVKDREDTTLLLRDAFGNGLAGV
ncbi:MAG: hypothetical protein BWY63_00161 [Chloroflexi bacterium ADurb.Bin360]|nr:MAG: hypothetical protein BWY63_00161 [Chloroflexi bacterium ADurb.Bin360]